MSARSPAKEKGQRVRHWPGRSSSAGYHLPALLQGQKQKFFTPETELRRCVVCNAEVTNRNLGGYDGRSALTGNLYCLACADGKGGTR
jgi:hypothetical protein